MDSIVEAQLIRRRRYTLVFLYGAFLLGGARAGFLVGIPQSQLTPGFVTRTDLFLAILYSLGSMWFCAVDSRLVGKPIIQLAKLGIFLFWPVGVPIYLCWAHRLRGLALLLVHGLAVLVTAFGAAIVTACLLYGFDVLF